MTQTKNAGSARHFAITGGKKLHGTIETNTSKNGAVGLLCASLLNKGKTVFEYMPRIEEVFRIIEVLESIGVEAVWEGNTLTLTRPKRLSLKNINVVAAKRTRSILMFIGPLIHEMRTFSLPQSGGCKLGSRTVRPHFYALENLGVSIEATSKAYKVKRRDLNNAEIVMYESGDTATENAIMAAAKLSGKTTIKYASANYMVQDLCHFLTRLGVQIEGIGTTTLVVKGKKEINTTVTYPVGEDPIDTMFFLTAAIMTNSSLKITRCPIDFLELELLVLKKMGFNYDIVKRYKGRNKELNLVDIKTHPSPLRAPEEKICARPYPGLNIDNLPFFAAIATQASGTTQIHDWTYEKRAIYYTELEKLGAEITLADTHRVLVGGVTKLKAAELVAPPALRPATILLLAMLGAKGHSVLRNVYTINRGYEDLVNRLQSLGASIEELHE